jgi:hypothetical protein
VLPGSTDLDIASAKRRHPVRSAPDSIVIAAVAGIARIPHTNWPSSIPQFFTAAAASAEIFEKAWTGNQAIIKMLAALIG